MDLPHPPTSSSDDQNRALYAMLDAFSCSFSLEHIADAYVKAKGDVNKAGDILTELQLSMPHVSDVEPSAETNVSKSDKPVEENYSASNSNQRRTLARIEKAVEEKHTKNSDQTRMPEKSKKSSATFGSVSSVLGKESATANRASQKDVAVKCSSSKGSCLGSQSSCSASSSQEEKRSSRPQISPGELLQAIFTVPRRLEEEPKGRRYDLGANRCRVPHRKPVLKPLEDVSSYSTDLPVKFVVSSKESAVDDEDYRNYHSAAKQHWDMMKQYYEKAVDAFRVGNQKEIDHLLQEGKNCYKMARLVDEKSAGEIIKSKKPESRNEISLDLTSQDAANVPNLLRLRLKQLANIPCYEYLHVIIGLDDGSFKMRQRWRKVMKYLEKNSIEWTKDESNPGSILVRINQVQNRQG